MGVQYKASIINKGSGYSIALSPYAVASNQPNLTTTVNANTLNITGISNMSGTVTETLQPSLSGTNIAFKVVNVTGNNLQGFINDNIPHANGTKTTANIGVNLTASLSGTNISITPSSLTNPNATYQGSTQTTYGKVGILYSPSLTPTSSGYNLSLNPTSIVSNQPNLADCCLINIRWF